jgi:pyridoxamine 5'-phosphate oxidase
MSAIDPEISELAQAFKQDETLPAELPGDPLPIFKQWFDAAYEQRITANPNAMTLATVDANGRPSARIVLCREILLDPGVVVFYSNRNSQKGAELGPRRSVAGKPDEPARAACVFHFDAFDKQVRIEGPVLRSPNEESDAYFNSRAPGKRIGAWTSDQSEPIASREELLKKTAEVLKRFGIDPTASQDEQDEQLAKLVDGGVSRPPHWGGYRVWAERVELWIGNRSRLHDRAVWTRQLTPGDAHARQPEATKAEAAAAYLPGAWTATRLQP